MSLFQCCTCPEAPGYDPEVDAPLLKYRNKCGCPTATLVECVSFQKAATLCGFAEYTDANAEPVIQASVPPKAYLVKTTKDDLSIRIVYDGAIVPCHGIVTTVKTASGETQVDSYSVENCDLTFGDWSGDGLADGTKIFNFSWSCPPDADPPDCPDFEGGECVILDEGPTTFDIEDLASARGYKVVSTIRKETNAFSFDSGSINKTLSEEDTEADALARATETEGTACTSIYELRTTSFSLIVRTVKFSLELTNLCSGRAYEGCVRIRKRKAFSGTVPDGEVVEWEDVEPFTFGPITATAGNTTDGVTTTAEITDQDLVGGTEDARGWEYEIVSAHVWPVSAGCDCPTELGYKDPA